VEDKTSCIQAATTNAVFNTLLIMYVL